MGPLKSLLTNKLESEKVSEKIQKIIFDIIFQHVQDMVFVMKVDDGPVFQYLFMNEAALRKAKLSISDLGKRLDQALPTKTAAFLQERYSELFIQKKAIMFNDVFTYEGGNKVYGETILTPVFNDNNDIIYVVAVTRDITAWAIEKAKLIESEQKYRSIVDNNMDAIFTITVEGKILEANPSARILTGFVEKQLRDRSIYDFIEDVNLADFKMLLEQTSAGFSLETMDIKFMNKKGKHLTVQMKTVPIAVFGEISGIYIICKDLSEQAQNMEMVKFMAFHDQLTGLRNRRSLLEHLHEQISSPSKKSKEFALISIDLDRFKYLNDTLGHLAGDEILKLVAARLSEFQNEDCICYRQGGDEFNILHLNTNRQATIKFVQKIFKSFSNSFYFNSHEYFISPSIGISMFPRDGKDAEMLIKNADEALFSVKEKGKGHYQFYRSDMKNLFTNIVNLETHLRKAIEKNEFSLFYQPQIDIKSGKVKSFEALLRWENNELGSISPSDFIPLAEDTGLIIPIGQWVIENACKQIKIWSEMGYDDIQVAINISPKQFQQPNLVQMIKSTLEKYRINPNSLGIEITERTMQDKKETTPILNKLKQLGVIILIDDFGTGYSSLNYIKQFPIDVLKIDQSFIRDILTDDKDAAITTTIIHLGKSLGLEVIAEGVETKEQVEFLTQTECTTLQGYYYSKPVSAIEVEKHFLVRQS